jgi:UPF0755 protein
MNNDNKQGARRDATARPQASRRVPMNRQNDETPRRATPSRESPTQNPTASQVSISAAGQGRPAAHRETPPSTSGRDGSTARRKPPQGSNGQTAKGGTPSRANTERRPVRRPSEQGTPKDAVSHPAEDKRKKRTLPEDNRKQASDRENGKKKKKRKKDSDGDEDYGGSTLIPSLVKAVIYIMAILVVSGVISYTAITVGNDVFAFVKEGDPVQITVADGTDVATLGKLLHEHGVIKYPKIFDLYIGIRYGDRLEFEPGDYTVDPSMGYDALVYELVKSNKEELVTVIVSIPEGYTVKQIISTLVNKYGLSTEAELTNAIQNADFDYWFIDELNKSGVSNDRKYRLEGYLYPDTYYYYSNASAETIINKMLKNFDTKMKNTFKNSTAPGDTYQDKILNLCKEREMSFDQIVTLASMIQMEAKFDYEYPKVSAVFNNRLRNPSATNGLLESCATVLYVLDIRVPVLSYEQTQTPDPYNTYLHRGLPPGAISNPTYLAINYAFYPDMECGFYFFVAAPDGTSLFAKTQKQHEENIKLVEEMRKDS